MQPITANSMALTHMRRPTVPDAAESKSKASVLSDEVPAAPPTSSDVSRTPSRARVMLTANDLAALQSLASDIPVGTPAEEARAAVAANSDLGNVPFGRLVSKFARGDIVLDSNVGNASASGDTSDQSSGSGGDVASTSSTSVDTPDPQNSSSSGDNTGASDVSGVNNITSSDTSGANGSGPSQSTVSNTASEGNAASTNGTDPGTVNSDAAAVDASALSAVLSNTSTSTLSDLAATIDQNALDTTAFAG